MTVERKSLWMPRGDSAPKILETAQFNHNALNKALSVAGRLGQIAGSQASRVQTLEHVSQEIFVCAFDPCPLLRTAETGRDLHVVQGQS